MKAKRYACLFHTHLGLRGCLLAPVLLAPPGSVVGVAAVGNRFHVAAQFNVVEEHVALTHIRDDEDEEDERGEEGERDGKRKTGKERDTV